MATFLNQTWRLGLAPPDLATLEARTEGWIAGLHLAALSMQGRADAADVVARFGGSHRFVLDYLGEQVFERQPAEVQSFLLETSILDRLSAPVCDATSGRTDSQAMLERLERESLFVVPIDDERRWYRYHHLFSEVLRRRLEQARPGRSAELHRRAGAWYEGQGLVRDAVAHALASGDLELAGRLVERAAPSLVRRGEMGTVRTWLDVLPPERVGARTRLALLRARLQYLDNRYDAVETTLRAIERPRATGEPVSLGDEVAGEIAAMRALVATGREDIDGTIAQARRALALLPAQDDLRGMVTRSLGHAHYCRGDLDLASTLMQEAQKLSQATGDLYGFFLASGGLANIHMFRGQLGRAAETYRRALRLGEERDEPLSAAGLALVGLAELDYERNDLAAATDRARDGIAHGEHLGLAWVVLRGKITLARVKQARGDHAGALAELAEPLRVVSPFTPSPLDGRVVEAYRACLLGQGRLSEVERWARESGLRADDTPDFFHEFEYLTFARALIAGREPTAVLPPLGRLLDLAEAQGRRGRAIEVLALQALAHQARGDPRAALAATRTGAAAGWRRSR